MQWFDRVLLARTAVGVHDPDEVILIFYQSGAFLFLLPVSQEAWLNFNAYHFGSIIYLVGFPLYKWWTCPLFQSFILLFDPNM
jgi:hypothetical protein